jgi:hypothetical protein
MEREENDKFIVGFFNNLAMHLVERICYTSKYDDWDNSIHDQEFCVHNIMCKLGAIPFIGQKSLLATSLDAIYSMLLATYFTTMVFHF